jgi:MbtH protein
MSDTLEQAGAPLFLVVRNAEEQYSIWAADRDLPSGWSAVGDPRTKDDCLSYIGEVWTDMRPASLRRDMAAAPGTAASDS